MKRPELLLGVVLALFAAFVGTQVVGAPSTSAAQTAAVREAADFEEAAGGPTHPVAPADPAVAAATRRQIRERGFGTYLDELLAAQDSALARWPGGASAIRVWVQPASSVAGWTPHHPQLGRDAFLAWQQAGLPLRFTFVGDSASADVQLVWAERVLPAPRIGSTHRLNDERGWIVSGVITVATHGSDATPLGESAVRTTALHEVGHLIGLNHTTDSTSIMAAELNDTHLLSASDKATAALLYSLPPGSVK